MEFERSFTSSYHIFPLFFPTIPHSLPFPTIHHSLPFLPHYSSLSPRSSPLSPTLSSLSFPHYPPLSPFLPHYPPLSRPLSSPLSPTLSLSSPQAVIQLVYWMSLYASNNILTPPCVLRFERLFKECVSSSAIRTKFEHHHNQGSEVVEDLESLLVLEEAQIQQSKWEDTLEGGIPRVIFVGGIFAWSTYYPFNILLFVQLSIVT